MLPTPNKKDVAIDATLTKVQKAFASATYEINGKKVTDYRFFKTISDEIKDKKTKKAFYWTDEKILLLFQSFGIKITKKTLSDIKKHL